MPRLLAAGWALEKSTEVASTVTAEDLRVLSRKVYEVDLEPVTELYADTVFKVRDLGIALSDRRAIKVLKLAAASALLCGRVAALPSDLWVLRYVWDREEQIGPLGTMIDGILRQQPGTAAEAHPLAIVQEQADGETLARQLEALEKEIGAAKHSLSALARFRERLTELADRAAWVLDGRSRAHLLDRTCALLERLG
jgi:MoxR-like ATPase